MKRLFLLITLLMTATAAIWAQDPVTQQQADKLDSLAEKLVTHERYGDAIAVKQRELDILRQLKGETDSSYISEMIFLAKYHYRNQQVEEAVNVTRKAVELYGQYVSTSDGNYAFYLDNLALYLGTLNRSAEAEETAKKALAVYEKLGRQDNHLAIILMHVAENCHANGRAQEAVKYELRSLNVMEQVFGEHSEEYIDELPYLQKYYEAAGDQTNAARIEKRIQTLTEEREKGYADLPKPVDFKTAEICHEHNDDVLEHCVYYLNHRLNAHNMGEAAKYILDWSFTSADVHILFGEKTSVLAAVKEYAPYMIAYIAATSYFCLTKGMERLDEEYYLKTIDVLLDFYEQNKAFTSQVDMLENYLKLREKGKLEKQLRKEFQKDIADFEKANSN